MTIVGSAQVRISPDGTGFSEKLRVILARQNAVAKTAGEAFGKAYADAAKKSMDGAFSGLEDVARKNAGKVTDAFVKESKSKLDSDLPAVYENAVKKSGDKAVKQSELLGRRVFFGFKRGVLEESRKDLGLADAIKTQADRAKVELGRSGIAGGRAYTDGIDEGVSTGMARVVTTIGSSFARGRSVAGNAGRNTGNSFTSELGKFLNRGIVSQSQQAYQAFAMLWAKGAAGGTALVALGNAISSMVGSLYALGTAAVQAGGALGVGLVSGIALAVQAGATLAVAFKGIAKAIGAGFKSAEAASKESAGATVGALRAVEDARKRLQTTAIQNAERLADADRRVAKAERDLRVATDEVAQAQERLNNAIKDANEELQQLNFSVEDAVLGEERALLSLESAQAALDKVQFLPVDSRARREAELAYKEAELNYRQAKDRASDLAEEQQRASETGVEGTKAYIDAENDLIAAKNREADAEEAVQEAKLARARAEADADRAMADARLALTRATEDLANAKNDAAKAADAYDDALANLSDSAKDFVKYLVGMKDRFSEFKKAVQEPFFATFNNGFERAVDILLPRMQDQLSVTSGYLGDMAEEVLNAAARLDDIGGKGSNIANLEAVMIAVNKTLAVFTERGENGHSALDNITVAIMRLVTAAEPMMTRFAKWISHLAELAEIKTQNMDAMTKTFNEWGDVLALIGDAIGELFGLLGTLGGLAKDAAKDMLKYFRDSFKDLNKDAKDNAEKIKKWFDDSAEVTQAWLDLLGKIVLLFLKLGGESDNVEGGMASIPKKLEEALPYVETILESFKSSGPILADIVVEVSRLMAALAESGALEGFFNTIKLVVTALADIAESGIAQGFLDASGPIFGILKAITLMGVGAALIGKVLLGGLTKPLKLLEGALNLMGLGKAAKKGGIAAGVSSALGKATGSSKKGKGKGGGLDVCVPVCPDVVSGKGKSAASGKTGRAASIARTAERRGAAGVGTSAATAAGSTGFLGTVGTKVKDALGPLGKFMKISGALRVVFFALKRAVLGFLGPIGLVIGAIWLAYEAFKWLYNNNETFKKFVDGIKEKISAFVEGAKEKWEQFKQAASAIWEGMKQAWDQYGAPVLETIKNAFKIFFLILSIPIAAVIALFDLIWQALKAGWEAWGVPLVETIKSAWKSFTNKLSEIWGGIKKKFTDIWNGVKTWYTENIQPWIDKLKGAWETFKTNVGKLWDGLKEKFKGPWEAIKSWWDGWVTPFIDKIVAPFKGIGEAIGSFFGNAKHYAAVALNGLIDFLNDFVVKNLNKVTTVFGVTIGKVDRVTVPPLAKKAAGGYISGPGGPTSDVVPALLSNGEYVMRASSVRKYGRSTFDALNHGTADGIGGLKLDDVPLIGGLLSAGVRATGEWIIEKALNPLVGMLAKDDGIVSQMARGLFSALPRKLLDWITREEKKNPSDGAPGGMTSGGAPGPKLGGKWYNPVYGSYNISRLWHPNPGGGGYWAADMAGAVGTPIVAITGGRVTTSEFAAGSYGWYVIVDHGAMKSLYAHMRGKGRGLGAVVAGSVLGYRGNTGKSYGSHLHFEVGPAVRASGSNYNPQKFMSQQGVKLATGGVVRATPGGVMAMLAEGGQHERVEPLDSAGMSARDYAMIDAVAKRMGGGAGPVLVKVYLGDTELRDMVRYEVVGSNHEVVRDLRIGRRRR